MQLFPSPKNCTMRGSSVSSTSPAQKMRGLKKAGLMEFCRHNYISSGGKTNLEKNTVWVHRKASAIEFSNLFCLFEISITLAFRQTTVRKYDPAQFRCFWLKPLLIAYWSFLKKSFLCASLKHFLMKKGWKKGISAIYKYVKMAIEKNEKHCARSMSEK